MQDIEFLGYDLTFNKREYELWKLPLNSSFCAVTADSKSRCPLWRKAYFRGVALNLFTPELKKYILPTF